MEFTVEVVCCIISVVNKVRFWIVALPPGLPEPTLDVLPWASFFTKVAYPLYPWPACF